MFADYFLKASSGELANGLAFHRTSFEMNATLDEAQLRAELAHDEWGRWWGSKDLVYRIADAARNAADTGARDAVKLDVEVRVRKDCERFTTPNGFRYRVTDQTVREWHHIRIAATGSDLEVWVRMSRRRRRVPAADYPYGRESGVIMGVTSLCAHMDPVPVRDEIEKVVERGVPAGTRKQRFEFTETRPSRRSRPKDSTHGFGCRRSPDISARAWSPRQTAQT